MAGKHSAWLVALPVVLTGCLAAHLVGYAVVEPGAHGRDELLARSGHGYLPELPLVVAGAVVLLLAAALHHALRGRAGARPRPGLFLALPPVAFALQEHAERWAHAGTVPAAAALEPAFLVGLALQLPFALLAWLLARAVLGTAEALAAAVRSARATAQRSPRLTLPTSALLPRLRARAAGARRRAPPLRLRPVL